MKHRIFTALKYIPKENDWKQLSLDATGLDVSDVELLMCVEEQFYNQEDENGTKT